MNTSVTGLLGALFTATGPMLMLGAVFAVVCFVLLMVVIKSLVRVCPPDTVLVITGAKRRVGDKEYGFRLKNGGWTFVLPYFQKVEELDVGIIALSVTLDQVNSRNGITVGADATACVCVDVSDPTLLYAAAERMLGRSEEEVREMVRTTLVGNFRGALNKTTPLEAIGTVDPNAAGDRVDFRKVLLEDSAHDLGTVGISVVSTSLQKMWDDASYVANLANRTLAGKRQEVEVREAALRRDAEQSESDADRRMGIAKSTADSQILREKRELGLFQEQCKAAIRRAALEADSAIAQARSAGGRRLQEANLELQQLKNQSNVILEAEAQQQASAIIAAGERQSVGIIKAAENTLLERKMQLIAEAGDLGRMVLFVQQQLPYLYQVYHENARAMTAADCFVAMDEKRGFNALANRGPYAFVDFLKQFEDGLGIRVADLLAVPTATE